MLRKTDPETIAPYLKDASNYRGGRASEVLVPESRAELIDFMKNDDRLVTLAGAGPGLTAGRIPNGGVIVSLERFRHLGAIDEGGSIEVGPAVTLKELNASLRGSGWFYPPNPTESLAALGGTVATNASGARSYKYGATRNYVLELDIVLADGRSGRVRRGQTIDHPLVLEDGSTIEFPDIRYRSPECKNAAGYYVRPGMDWVDLLVGSEGTLAAFAGMRLRLLPAPDEFLSGILFLQNEEACWHLVQDIRGGKGEELDPCSLEYFDRFSLERLRSRFPGIPAGAEAALFFEQAVTGDPDPCLEAWYSFLEPREVLLDESWFAQSAADLEKFHAFRHELPLILNEENSRRGRVKMGTDLAVGDGHLIDMMQFYRSALEKSGLDYVMFGHIGDNHLHINLLPEAGQETPARALYQSLVERILELGGTVSAEHGIGKLKREYFLRMAGLEARAEMLEIKKKFDPRGRLGPGNLL